MNLLLSFLIVASSFVAHAAEDCLLCEGRGKLTCTTCHLRLPDQPCVKCQAKGKMDCPDCPETKTHNRGETKVGWIDCPQSTCNEGKTTWSRSGEKDPCKFCGKKGAVKCPRCKSKGEIDCNRCLGRKTVTQVCHDCVGTETISCPMCFPITENPSCLWCQGKGKRHCGGCYGRVLKPDKCHACSGLGKSLCKKCSGIGRKPCSGCGGTGRVRSVTMFSNSKAGNKRHSDCKGKGVVKCSECKGGKNDCETCDRGKTKSCRHCDGKSSSSCRGCDDWNAGRSFEFSADLLERRGYEEEALEYYLLANEAIEAKIPDFDELVDSVKKAKEALEKLKRIPAFRVPNRGAPKDSAEFNDLEQRLERIQKRHKHVKRKIRALEKKLGSGTP